MKKIALIALAACTAVTTFAQKAQVKVQYQENYKNWTDANVRKDFLLLAGEDESRYFNPMTQTVDSMLSTPQGTVQFNTMVEAANAAGQRPALLPQSRTYIIKNRPQGTMLCYGEAAGETGYYTEPFSDQNWQIGDSTKTVLDYECVVATADYHGRHWTAWFAPEIPVSDGPWKLCGLPGLILEASADNGAYIFVATGLESVDIAMPSKIYGHDKAVKTDRKEMLSTEWQFYNTYAAQMYAEFGIPLEDEPLPKGFDLIETDYKK